MNVKVNWSRTAGLQLKEVFNYIQKDSPANAKKVRIEILAASRSLYLHPKKHPADKDKLENDGSYRAFVLYRYRISYKINESGITILRMRHTSMEPKEY